MNDPEAVLREVVLALSESHNALVLATPDYSAEIRPMCERSRRAIEQLQLAGGLDDVLELLHPKVQDGRVFALLSKIADGLCEARPYKKAPHVEDESPLDTIQEDVAMLRTLLKDPGMPRG